MTNIEAIHQFDGELGFERGCRGKRLHLSMESAKIGAKQMHRKFHKKYNAYRCLFCDGWHVGTRRNR